jgi:DNA (cytosine-5)-methyltransferase 1
LPTPRARDATGARPISRRTGIALNDLVISLATQLPTLPTPRASEGTKGSPNQHGSRGDLTLTSKVIQMWQHRSGRVCDERPAFDWQQYAPAIQRWEAVMRRPVPSPIERGTRGQPRLASRFVEWLMGLPAGYVTDLGLPRSAELRAFGNGVVPQQAEEAVHQLLTFTGTL